MSETIEAVAQKDVLELELTMENQWMLEKLATWGKVVAIINIIFGIINCLTIFVMAIPIVVVGVIMILMGTKLNSATAHFRYGLYQKDSASFVEGLNQVRQYLLYNGILMLMMVVLLAILIMVALFAGEAINELMQEYQNYM